MRSGQIGQLVRVLSQNSKVVGLIPGQDTYKSQPMNAYISETTNWPLSFSIYLKNKKSRMQIGCLHLIWTYINTGYLYQLWDKNKFTCEPVQLVQNTKKTKTKKFFWKSNNVIFGNRYIFNLPPSFLFSWRWRRDC